MEQYVNVEIGGEVKQYLSGTTLAEIAKEYQKDYDADIILAYRDGRLRELFKKTLKCPL